MDANDVLAGMPLRIFAYGFALFFCSLIAHVLVWRHNTPRASTLSLVWIFLVIPAGFFLSAIAGFLPRLGCLSWSRMAILEVWLLHFSLSSAYLASYPAARAVSPSLDILLMIASAPEQKLSERDIEDRYRKMRVVGARIDDLMQYRLIRDKGGLFVLSPVAQAIVRVFILYRRMLGLPIGGG